MRAVEASSRNEAVIQQAQNEVRSAQASIKFLEDELPKLQLGGQGPGAGGSPMRGEASGSAGRGMMTPSRSGGSAGTGATGNGNGMASPSFSRRGGDGTMERPLPPPPMGDGQGEVRKEQKNYTQLGESLDSLERLNDISPGLTILRSPSI